MSRAYERIDQNWVWVCMGTSTRSCIVPDESEARVPLALPPSGLLRAVKALEESRIPENPRSKERGTDASDDVVRSRFPGITCKREREIRPSFPIFPIHTFEQ